MNKSLKYIAIFSLLGGCAAFGNDWPNLADPLPISPERSQLEASPVVKATPMAVRDSRALTPKDAYAAFASFKTALEDEWLAYGSAVKLLSEDSGIEANMINWNGAQLVLSRVSAVIGNIQDLTMSAFDEVVHKDAVMLEEVRSYVSANETRLNTAREYLISKKP